MQAPPGHLAQVGDRLVVLPKRPLFSALELHGVAIGTVAAMVLLIGWGFDVALLKQIVPGFPDMKALTAASFMMLSMSCVMSLRGSERARIGAIVLSGLALGLVAAAHFLDPERLWDGSWRQIPSEATLVCLGLAATGMLIILLAPRWRIAAAAFALAGATPALYRMLAMILFGGAPETGSPMDTMALHTAILLVWFMIACVLMHPRLGFGDAFFQSSLRGRVLRRSLPIVIAVPVAASALSLAAHLLFDWPDEILHALTATLSVTLGVGLLWQLSQLVADWQVEANEHANRLERANEALEQYASSAAHDLKAPVRHVMLYGELLEEAIARSDADAIRKCATSIRNAASELPALIDGMLDFSRSGFSKLKPGDHLLSELVQSAATLQEADLRAAGAKVIVAQEALLWCDPQLMSVVFQNLIANSISNRRPDRPLEVRIDAARAGGAWQIAVEDNGQGFDPDFASVAFNPLARGVKLAGDGTGIGLATCRTILASHGGDIRVNATFRGGARIEIILPEKASTGSGGAGA